ncbi:protein of unknown function [Prevotella sp. ne3005]|nr:protein of unknown function [Prevotella sp. ne3005]
MGLLLVSCQSDSYQVNGFAHQLKEGDTICLAHGSTPGLPFALTTVSGGKFWLEGPADETVPCCVYLKRQPACAAVFFPDHGTIAVELNLPPTPSRISGTNLNNEWQQMNDAIQRMGNKLFRIIERQDSDSIVHLARLRAVDSLHREMSDLIVNTGQRNRDNPLGRFILENYKEPEFQ